MEEEQVKCNECGAHMKRFGNLWVCTNLKRNKQINGKQVIEPCRNTFPHEVIVIRDTFPT